MAHGVRGLRPIAARFGCARAISPALALIGATVLCLPLMAARPGARYRIEETPGATRAQVEILKGWPEGKTGDSASR
ncbi:MAG: hypothetical protein ACRD3D_01410 [Terriglobia bacterium]